MRKVLIVEDEAAVRDQTAELLASNNFEPQILTDFEHPLDQIQEYRPDLILLDINIPGLDGRELLREFRKTSSVPVIIVTAHNSELNEALTISYGADDFIAKPYNPQILLLRINAVLKRVSSNNPSAPISYQDLTFNPTKATLQNPHKIVSLTRTELIIFTELLSHQGEIVTREQLMTLLWNNSSFLNDNTLTVNISRLRDKLAKLGHADAIVTKKNMGYYLQ